jgi:hypothetical protein
MDNRIRDAIAKAYVELGQTEGVIIKEFVVDGWLLKGIIIIKKDKSRVLALNANESLINRNSLT